MSNDGVHMSLSTSTGLFTVNVKETWPDWSYFGETKEVDIKNV